MGDCVVLDPLDCKASDLNPGRLTKLCRGSLCRTSVVHFFIDRRNTTAA